jgi:hypothetical protein
MNWHKAEGLVMTNNNEWYGIVEGKRLQQGDLIVACPVIKPLKPVKMSDISVEIEINTYNVIILSQSCDLEVRKNTGKPRLDFVLVCQIWPLGEFEQEITFFKSKDAKEGLRRGYQPSYHLLNKCDFKSLPQDFLVVDFTSVNSVHFDTLTDIAEQSGKHLSLLSPYKEHLAQAFARFFMRVGLPADIPKFSNKVEY